MANDQITISAMAKHLGLSSAYLRKLASENVIERRPNGRFDETATRLRYLQWLRSPERRSAHSTANSEFRRLRSREVSLRIAKMERELIPVDDALGVISEICGIMRSEIEGLPARLTRDRQLLRQIEDEVAASLKRMSEKAGVMARDMKG